MENIEGYHNLLIWQKAKELAKLIYKITDNFPRTELFGLTSQLRRAAISVVLNIVEGDRRSSKKELLRFLDIADSSLAEVEACLEIVFELNFLSEEDFQQIDGKRKELAVMLLAFIKKVKTR